MLKVYNLYPNGKTVTVNFNHDQIDAHPDDLILRMVTYCTMVVRDNESGKTNYYHGFAVWNGKDHYKEDGGDFYAFKRALMQRFEDYVKERYKLPSLISLQELARLKKEYCKRWGAVLWQVKNDKSSNDSNSL